MRSLTSAEYTCHGNRFVKSLPAQNWDILSGLAKQQALSSDTNIGIRFPRIFDLQMREGFGVRVEMERIRGIQPYYSGNTVLQSVERFIGHAVRNSVPATVSSEPLLRKLLRIRCKSESDPIWPCIRDLWGETHLFFRGKYLDILLGPCHGDFSTTNIVLCPDSMETWSFDLLPSPIESVVLDIAKLRASIRIGLHQFVFPENVVPTHVDKQWLDRLEQISSMMDIAPTVMSHLEWWQILRIAPYVKNNPDAYNWYRSCLISTLTT